MSQSGSLNPGGGFVPPSVPTSIVTNSGTAVPALSVLQDLGAGSITTTGSGNTVTTSLTGLTQFNLLVGQGTSTIGTITNGTTGQVLTAVTGGYPIWAASGVANPETLTGNSGGPISPVANNINTIGAGSITIVGSGSTLTTQLTGLTNHSVLLGAGTSTITSLTNGTTGQVLTATTGGNPTWVTPAAASAFLAYVNTAIPNVTGDDTFYVIIYDTKTGIGYDVGSNFSTVTGLFTAPVAGKYLFNATYDLTGLSAGVDNTLAYFYYNSTTPFRFSELNHVSGQIVVGASGSIILNMAANDTLGVVVAANNGTKTAAVRGVEGGVYLNYFSGYILH